MTTNVGSFDRAARIILGVALIGATVQGLLPSWGWIGVVPLATGLLRICPLYSVLGISTCPTAKN